MTYRIRATVYLVMMLLVSVVIVGVYLDRPRASADMPAASTEDTTYVPQATDGPVVDAKPEAVNQA